MTGLPEPALDRLLTLFDGDAECVERVAQVAQAVTGAHCDRGAIEARRAVLAGYQTRLRELVLAPGFAQRTPEWYEARRHVVTASELLQATGSASGKRQFLKRKCSPESVPSLAGCAAIRHGVMYEDVACRAYERRNRVRVHEFGLLPSRRITCFGASPDGVASTGVMLEIKCPYSRAIRDGHVKPEYYQQMQGQLYTAELEECDFLECKIVQYESEADFSDDAHPDEAVARTALTRAGLEKGAVAFRDDAETGREVYRYSRADDATPAVAAWAREQIAEGWTVAFYRLDEYNCQRVRLDPNFMVETEPKIRASFALFQKYKEDPAQIDVDFPDTRGDRGDRGGGARGPVKLKPFAFLGLPPASAASAAASAAAAAASAAATSSAKPPPRAPYRSAPIPQASAPPRAPIFGRFAFQGLP